MSIHFELALLSVLALTGCHSSLPGDGAALDASQAAQTDLAVTSVDGGGDMQGPDAAMERLPWDRDLSLVVRGLATSEGKTAWLRIDYRVMPTKTPWRQVTIRDGVVMMFWAGGFDSNTFGEYVDLFVDGDGNGACTEGADPAWQIFINNNFQMGAVKTETDVSDPGDHWAMARTCAQLMM